MAYAKHDQHDREREFHRETRAGWNDQFEDNNGGTNHKDGRRMT